MAFCESCRSMVEDGKIRCPNCGANIGSASNPVISKPIKREVVDDPYSPQVTKATGEIKKFSLYAVLSFISGIIGLFAAGMLFGVAAVGLGTLAIKDYDETKQQGIALAKIGRVLGIVAIIGWGLRFLLTLLSINILGDFGLRSGLFWFLG